MKILSWDVGIYNLSYCILEINEDKTIKILSWDIVNLVDNENMKKNRNLLFENIPRKLYEIPELLNVDIVVIENQPSLKNPQMKSIQMILYSYFLILGKVIGNGNNSSSYIETIEFCSASNKLKVYDGPKIVLSEKKTRKNKTTEKVDEIIKDKNVEIKDKDIKIKDIEIKDVEIKDVEIKEDKKGSALKYADKKRLAIEHAKYFLEKQEPVYLEFFNNHKKKDDLADSFLQGIYYLKNKKVTK